MRVLIVNDYGRPVGGAERMSLALRDGLRRRGHEASLFASSACPLPVPNQADHTCLGSQSSLGRLLRVANPWAVTELRRVLASYRPDVVHVRMFLTQLSPLILPLLRRVPSVLQIVNYQAICPLNTKLLPDGRQCHFRAGAACYREGCVSVAGWGRSAAQRVLWQRWRDAFDVVVANSEWTKERLRQDGIDVAEAIANGVRVRTRRPPLASPPTVGFAGRFVGKKGLDVLLRAMAHVVNCIPDARLLVAGDGPDREAVERRIAELDLGQAVSMLGFLSRPDLENRLDAAWVQAVPSLWEEPFGLVAAEGMMRGTAVVASDAGALSHIVRDGHTGLLAPPGSVDALVDALHRLLLDRQLAERMGECGHEVALAEFDEERVVERFLCLYHELSAKPA
jgi:glycosyltransferase involved in cell wall biosynthesis